MERLTNPPIREAVWEMAFANDPLPTLALMEEFGQHMRSSYPVLQHTHAVQITFGPEGEQPLPPTQVPDGIRLSNPSRPFVVLLKANVLAVARLRPYTSFEDLRGEGLQVLADWLRFVPDANLVRLALRYVNEYRVSFAEGEFIGDYVQLVPHVMASEFPQMLDAYAVQMTPVYSPDKQAAIAVNFQPVPGTDQTSIVLDITVSQNGNFGQDANAMTETTAGLRELKNRIFRQLVGPKAYALFNA